MKNSALWQTFSIWSWFTFIVTSQKETATHTTSSPCGDCLILTPFIRNGSATAARELSEVKHEEFLGVKSYSGFITVNDAYDSNIFFWYFPARGKNASDTPWIIWLQGGPGYSSMFGVFNLHGPFVVTDDKVSLRNLSWTEDYSVLYIDNPVGAGFSFTGQDRGYTTDEEQVGEQLLEFLEQFLEVFPELTPCPLFIAGESYAGKYVPALGHQIQKRRHRWCHEINLKGLMIGNGLVDPLSMLHHSELVRVLGILTDEQSDAVERMQTEAATLVKAGRMVESAQKFNETMEYIKNHSSVDMKNMNKDRGTSELSFLNFLARSDIRQSLHVHNASYDLNSQVVYEKMLPDFMNSTKPWVEELLEDYAVLCYSGQLDLVIPYWGSKHLYSSLQWSGREQYQKAPRIRLRLTEGGPVVGYKRTGGNFTDILIRNAGHMVPKDNPRVAKLMLDDFIQENASIE